MATIALKSLLSRNWTWLGVTGLAGLSGIGKPVDTVQRFDVENAGSLPTSISRTAIMVIDSGVASNLAPINGISALAKPLSARKTQKIISNSLSNTSVVGRTISLDQVAALEIPCLVMAGIDAPNEYMVRFADRTATTLICSIFDEYLLASRFLGLLQEKLQMRLFIQGALVNVDGLGVLITGVSGIGKTNWALELAERGHRWIADDAVEIERRSDGRLYGRSHRSVKNLLEIKGKGIFDIRNLLPDRLITEETVIDMIADITKAPESSKACPGSAGQAILGIRPPLMKFPISYRDDRNRLLEMAVKTLKEKG